MCLVSEVDYLEGSVTQQPTRRKARESKEQDSCLRQWENITAERVIRELCSMQEGESLRACSRGSKKAAFSSHQYSKGEQCPGWVTTTEGDLSWRAGACISTCPGQRVFQKEKSNQPRSRTRRSASSYPEGSWTLARKSAGQSIGHIHLCARVKEQRLGLEREQGLLALDTSRYQWPWDRNLLSLPQGMARLAWTWWKFKGIFFNTWEEVNQDE